MLTKYAQLESILEVKSSRERLGHAYGEGPNAGLQRFAALNDGVREDDGYLYVRARAISSRVNKNNDGWPSEELAKSYKSFVGRPIFVDHNNDDPKRTRGVIVSSDLQVDDDKTSGLDPYYATAPDNHKPPTWVELLMEVDAKTFPRLAKAIRNEDIDAVSMGANIDLSKCSVCDNEATTPSEYCSHIKQKGTTFEITGNDGERIKKKAYEDCYGIVFFEESFVFDPADDTADILDKTGSIEKEAGIPEWFTLAASAYGAWNAIGMPALWLAYRDKYGENPNFVKAFFGGGAVLPAMAIDTVNDARSPYGLADNSQTERLRDMIGKKLPSERLAALKIADMAEQFVKPIGTEDVPPHDRNYTPQVDMTTAPQKVDTLREETRCPICHAADMESDPDGIKRCPICGHVQEPEPVDNPDLGLARDVDLRQDVTQQTTPEGDKEISTDGLGSGNENNITFQPVEPVQAVGATNYNRPNQGIDEMFKTKLRTESKEEADKILPAKAGRVETVLGQVIHPGVYRALTDAGLKAKFIYPAVKRADNYVEAPGPNGVMNTLLARESARTLGKADFSEIPFIIEADSQEHADLISELIKETRPETPEARAAKVVQAAGVVELDGRRYRLIEVEDKVEEEESEEKEETEEDSKEKDSAAKEADRRHIVRTETNEDGTTRSEEIVEESDGSTTPEASTEEKPVQHTKPEDLGNTLVPEEPPAELVGVSKVDAEKMAEEREEKLLASFKLADLSVELGVIEEDDKMAFIAEIEEETQEQIEARAKTLESVKTAGLIRRGSVVKQVPGLKRVPRLSHTVPMVNSNGIDSTPDEAIYL